MTPESAAQEPDFRRAELLMDGRVRYMPPVSTTFPPKRPRAVVTITVEADEAAWFGKHLPMDDDMAEGFREIAARLLEINDV